MRGGAAGVGCTNMNTGVCVVVCGVCVCGGVCVSVCVCVCVCYMCLHKCFVWMYATCDAAGYIIYIYAL